MSDEALQIRLATMDDLADVQSCARAAYSRYIERMDRVPAPIVADYARSIVLSQLHVAHRNSDFVGYVLFYANADHLHLENMAVVPSCWGQGIGRRLIKYVEQAALGLNLHAIELYTNEAMTENLTMYPKLGYMEFDRKQQAGFSRVFFRKKI